MGTALFLLYQVHCSHGPLGTSVEVLLGPLTRAEQTAWFPLLGFLLTPGKVDDTKSLVSHLCLCLLFVPFSFSQSDHKGLQPFTAPLTVPLTTRPLSPALWSLFSPRATLVLIDQGAKVTELVTASKTRAQVNCARRDFSPVSSPLLAD